MAPAHRHIPRRSLLKRLQKLRPVPTRKIERLGPERDIDDPALKRMKLGPDLEPPEDELLKGPAEVGDRAATGGPAAPETRAGAARRIGPRSFLQVLGPGLITGASDDDPSGIGTYSQAGAQFGYGVLWTALFTFPLMLAMQELCARIALHTGVGLGLSLRRRFPTSLVGVCILAMVVANTINIGADLGAVAAGGSLLARGRIAPILLVVPAAALIVALQLFATYRLIFNAFKWLTLALFAYVITAFLVHPPAGQVLIATFVPHLEFDKAFITTLVAILGTTISPYLFFWQASSEVDEMRAAGQRTERERKGVTQSELHAARIDVFVGMAFSQVVMYSIILVCAATLNVHGETRIATADQAARALEPLAGSFAFVLFAAGLIGTGLLAIPVLSGSAAYALAEFAGIQGTLAEKPKYRPTFYAVIVLATVAGVALNLLHIDVINALFYTAVINGVVAPPLMILIAILGSDKRVMQQRVSGRVSVALVWIATIAMTAATLLLIVTLLPRGPLS
jgi:NRAMP (natural resistance-associated macrophage protein)-like metal ion transporter